MMKHFFLHTDAACKKATFTTNQTKLTGGGAAKSMVLAVKTHVQVQCIALHWSEGPHMPMLREHRYARNLKTYKCKVNAIKNFCNPLGSGYHLPLAASNTPATINKTFNEGKFVLKHKKKCLDLCLKKKKGRKLPKMKNCGTKDRAVRQG